MTYSEKKAEAREKSIAAAIVWANHVDGANQIGKAIDAFAAACVAEALEPWNRGVLSPREFFDLAKTGELVSNFSEKDLISYAEACIHAVMQVGRTLLSKVEGELAVEKEENAKEREALRSEVARLKSATKEEG